MAVAVAPLGVRAVLLEAAEVAVAARSSATEAVGVLGAMSIFRAALAVMEQPPLAAEEARPIKASTSVALAAA